MWLMSSLNSHSARSVVSVHSVVYLRGAIQGVVGQTRVPSVVHSGWMSVHQVVLSARNYVTLVTFSFSFMFDIASARCPAMSSFPTIQLGASTEHLTILRASFSNASNSPPFVVPSSSLNHTTKMAPKDGDKDKDSSKVHKLALRGSAKLVAEFVRSLAIRRTTDVVW